MSILTFDSDNTLAGGLYAMTPRESIQLGIGLCGAVEQSVGADSCHGGVWPGNISTADGQVAIGPACTQGITDMSPDALEFVAPEQFWSGSSSPASDVYSIGLILYTALNGGVMPFFTTAADHVPEERAAALQNRMKGKTLPYPAAASRALGEVVLKAMAFRAEDRYATPGRLKAALESLPESAAIPAVAPVIPLSEAEIQNAHSYKVDKDFEKTLPEKPKKSRRAKKDVGAVDEDMDAHEFRTAHPKGRLIIPIVLVVVIIAAIVLLLRGCGDYYDPTFPVNTEPAGTADLIHSPVPDSTTAPTETPAASTAVTEAPVETPAAQPVYKIFVEDVTWEEARELCDQQGGHLATIHDEAALQEVIALAEDAGASFVWLGAYRGGNGQWYYVTGEPLDYSVWDTGEPSAMDNDGTPENYLLLWYRAATGNWTYNDMRNDPISVVPRTYSGKTAYICQFD